MKILFSWVILMPIAVIVGGKLLVQVLRLPGQSKQVFQVRIPGTLNLHAHNDEVILGFTGFLITLLIIGVGAGQQTYRLFKRQFGIDPGQFNSLCVMSSFMLVLLAAIMLTVSKFLSSLQRNDPVLVEHKGLIEGLAAADRAPIRIREERQGDEGGDGRE